MYILTDMLLKHQYKRAKKLETITKYLLDKWRKSVYQGDMLKSDYRNLHDTIKSGDLSQINSYLTYNYWYKILHINQ